MNESRSEREQIPRLRFAPLGMTAASGGERVRAGRRSRPARTSPFTHNVVIPTEASGASEVEESTDKRRHLYMALFAIILYLCISLYHHIIYFNMQTGGYIYIMTNKNKTVLYIGVTNNLQRRIMEHSSHINENAFTTKYNLEHCIYYEYFTDITLAIAREKQLKQWSRAKKEALIVKTNPEWKDFSVQIRKWIM